jgi:hypothetical protein
VAGLKASQMVIYVAGNDGACHNSLTSDNDGDDAGPTAVHIGEQNVVQANIVALNGTVWLKSKTQATGSFIGLHVRIGQNVTLTDVSYRESRTMRPRSRATTTTRMRPARPRPACSGRSGGRLAVGGVTTWSATE